MENKLNKYKKYKRNIKFLLNGSGLWPYLQPPRLRIFLIICAGFNGCVTSIGMLSYCVDNVTSINALTRGLGLTISYTTMFLKIVIFGLRKKDIESLNEGMSTCFENDLSNPEYQPHLLAYLSSFTRFYYIFNYSVALIVIMMGLSPFLMLRHGKYVRMYPEKIPFNFEPGGVVYWCIYLFNVLCGYYCWSVTLGVDSIFGLYALQMIGELKVLALRFEKLSSDKNYRRELKTCVERHVLLTKSHRTMRCIFGFLAIFLAITCAIVICALIFQASEAKNISADKAIYIASYCILKFVQAYGYAWYGHIITVESESCLNSIYNAQWPGCGDINFMNDVLIIQSQKPLLFQAMGCMIVRLDMFSKVVNTTVSYFFLLKTLAESSTETPLTN